MGLYIKTAVLRGGPPVPWHTTLLEWVVALIYHCQKKRHSSSSDFLSKTRFACENVFTHVTHLPNKIFDTNNNISMWKFINFLFFWFASSSLENLGMALWRKTAHSIACLTLTNSYYIYVNEILLNSPFIMSNTQTTNFTGMSKILKHIVVVLF